jgi:protocatechuate 3,4-dioxygenase beta subunit
MWRDEKCLIACAVFLTMIAGPADVLWSQGFVKQVDCSGTVVDWRGYPVADAEVVGCEQLYDYACGRTSWAAPSRMITGQDGRFHLQVSADRKDYIYIVSWKKGLALGWQSIRFGRSEQDMLVRLGEPAVLAGTVVDEAGRGVSGATVRLCLKMAWMGGSPGVTFQTPQDWFTARTDGDGRFRFDHVPAGGTADLWVEAPGKASCWTYWEHELSSLAGTQFQAGRTDIRVILKPEGIIRGKVVNEDSGEGVAGIRLLARPNAGYANYSCVPPVTTGPGGDFIYKGLAANDYSLQVVAPYGKAADWVGKDVKVTVETGQTAEVNVPVSKGGLVEVTILDAKTEKPIENAAVNVSIPANFGLHPCWYNSVRTDADGLGRLRVPPGESRLRMWAKAYDYFTDPEPVIIAKGETIRREVSLVAYPFVTGIVRDPDGQPVAGAVVSSKPVCEEASHTDERGRFKVTWRPISSIRVVLVLARDTERNLAGLAEVKEQAQSLDVTLSPAFMVRGRITDPDGKAIPAAIVSLQASMPGWGTDAAPAVFTDANGFYEVCAVPASTENFRYRLEVRAEGFGPVRQGKLPFGTAQDRKVEVAPIVLMPADKSISGVIVDANGAPVAGVPIFITGPRGNRTGQPRQQSSSDEHGRFAVDGVCAGPLRIQAAFGSRPGGAGFLDAKGGDRDVEVVLGRSGVHTGIKPLLGKSLPDWKELIDLKPEQVQNKRLLFCFFDFQQRPSRNMIQQMAGQADSLVQKGIVVAAVQASQIESDTLQAWAKKNNLPFPVGTITGDVETTRTAWGVKALPWLILTDRRHVVVAEGFGIDGLEDKIHEARSTQRQ